MNEFTEWQIQNWKIFERIRQSGIINMLDSATGSKIAGITKDEYEFCLFNYSGLKSAANKQKD